MGVRHFEKPRNLGLIDGNPAVVMLIGLLGCHRGLWVVWSLEESPTNILVLAEIVTPGSNLITGKPDCRIISFRVLYAALITP
jgi:hypothetical protein